LISLGKKRIRNHDKFDGKEKRVSLKKSYTKKLYLSQEKTAYKFVRELEDEVAPAILQVLKLSFIHGNPTEPLPLNAICLPFRAFQLLMYDIRSFATD
jgi:hypothetical protein